MDNYNNSKSTNLLNIEKLSSLFQVPKLMTFSVLEFNKDPDALCNKIEQYFDTQLIAVRSSAGDEDNDSFSAAGMYESVLNILSNDRTRLVETINKVINSYKQQRSCNEYDEIIVQEMVHNPSLSGVVFTHELNTGAPYYVINYDDISGLTDTVTSGGGEYSNRTLYVHRGSLNSVRSARFKSLLDAVSELETIMDSQFLDIEFALDNNLKPFLLQVRAITTLPNWNRALSKKIDSHLMGIKRFVKERFKRSSGVFGQTTVLSQMSDWNPAEIIGRAPRALSFSLYEKLITDFSWSYARKKMGYSTPDGHSLMLSLSGQPFIDTRLSFHSYLPQSLPDVISEKLVNFWVEKLKTHPELHDKVEFDVATTVYSFDINERVDELRDSVLTLSEVNVFKQLLHAQTQMLINGQGEGSIDSAMDAIKDLETKQAQSSIAPEEPCISNLLETINDCIHLGTVPFSILARHGFIARTLLLSLQSCGILTVNDVEQFQASIHTVASELVDNMHQMELGNLDLKDIMNRYGHLRPGTYDILSSRYDQMDRFGKDNDTKLYKENTNSFELSLKKQEKINLLLKQHNFADLDADKLFHYFRQAIIGREYAKFIFTHTVSDMLELIANFGQQHGLSRDEMSHIPLSAINDVTSKSSEYQIEEYLRKISQDNAEKHTLSVAIRLPQVLFDLEGIHVVPFQISHPNFITNRKITALKVVIDPHSYPEKLTGNIVMIENADPGFDWIFAKNIGGLVTKYGGANSHMAIRCAEFGIPAAIGCGEQRYEALLRSKYILLDATSGLVKSLH